MNDAINTPILHLSISAVERDTGLSKDTLRIWERRYGFPMPQRDTQGERMYPFDQLEKLRLIKRLLDAGHRPGHVVGQPVLQLRQLVDQFSQPFVERRRLGHTPGPAALAELQRLMEQVQQHEVRAVRRALGKLVARRGLHFFIFEIAVPLLGEMSDALLRGRIQPFQELWVRECLENVLRQELATIPDPPADTQPRIVLATLPGEQRNLGRLIVQGLATLDGAECLSLGQQAAPEDIAQAAMTYRAHIVVISYSNVPSQGSLNDGLTFLRSKLPEHIELWASNSPPSTPLKSSIDGIYMLGQSTDLVEFVDRWRAKYQVCP